MNRDRKLIFLTVLYFAILGCFLLGCSEGTDSSPVSALMGEINTNSGFKSANKITGKVLNSSTNTTIPNVYVQLLDINENFIMGALTDENGIYSFNGMDNGTYTMFIRKTGYEDFDLNEQNPKECNVSNGKTTPDNYILFLTPGSSSSVKVTVAGSVVSTDKNSTANKKIFLHDNEDNIVDATTILGNGTFYFYDVPADGEKKYTIKTDETSYPITVKNGSVNPSSITITINKTNSVIGTLVNSSNNEILKNISVKLKKGKDDIKTILSDSDGNFNFTNLEDGDYKIDIVSELYAITEDSITNYNIVKGKTTPESNIILLKSKSGVTNNDTVYATVSGVVKHSNNSIVSSATATLYKKKYGENPKAIDETAVLGDGSFIFYLVPGGSGYYIEITDEDATDKTRYDIGIDETGKVLPSNIIITVNLETEPEYITSFTFKIVSAYTGAPLELATIKINNENIGATDISGQLSIGKNTIIKGRNSIEISKEGFETLTCTKELNDMNEPLSLTMIEDTKDGYGSITGRYVNEVNGNGLGEQYVRLYRLIERTQTKSINTGNLSETWYDVDKSYILTTKTSDGSDNNGLKGSFKLTHIEPGVYQVYISDSPVIPSKEQRSQIYDDFEWTQIKGEGNFIITQPLKVVSDQTTYWTNYEQEYKQGN